MALCLAVSNSQYRSTYTIHAQTVSDANIRCKRMRDWDRDTCHSGVCCKGWVTSLWCSLCRATTGRTENYEPFMNTKPKRKRDGVQECRAMRAVCLPPRPLDRVSTWTRSLLMSSLSYKWIGSSSAEAPRVLTFFLDAILSNRLRIQSIYNKIYRNIYNKKTLLETRHVVMPMKI